MNKSNSEKEIFLRLPYSILSWFISISGIKKINLPSAKMNFTKF